MNKFNTSLLVSVLLLFSCEKYVDIQNDSTKSLITNAKDCQLLLDNSNVMNSNFPNDGELSADDIYLTDVSYNSTILNQTDRDLYIWSSNAIRPSADPQWVPSYYCIYRANLILESLNKLHDEDGIDLNTFNNLRGSALFFRAFAYWQLAQIYCKPYSLTSQAVELGLPLRTSSDINEKISRSTLLETYSQIINDLQESSELLPLNSSVATRPNKVSTYAMLARVYLSMEDYSKAFLNADAALRSNSQLLNYNTLSTTSSTPFSPAFNKEVIFHSVTANGLAVNPTSQGRINPSVISLYDNSDLRKSIFFKSVTGGNFRFSGNYSGFSNGNLFNGLAVDELYLIRAECYARGGDVSNAMLDLNTLLKTRWKGTYIDLIASNTNDALTKILTERRKELIMRGLRWMDLRRLNKDNRFATTLSRTVQGQLYTLLPNDIRYTLLIPNEVIVNGSTTQNSR